MDQKVKNIIEGAQKSSFTDYILLICRQVLIAYPHRFVDLFDWVGGWEIRMIRATQLDQLTLIVIRKTDR